MMDLGHEGKAATVLVVDDDARLLNVVAGMVEFGGYRAITARDAMEAVEAFESVGLAVDLLLSDVKMPGMTGPELVAYLRARKPDLSVILMSGTTEGLSVDAPLLEKPFGLMALQNALVEALTRPQQSGGAMGVKEES